MLVAVFPVCVFYGYCFHYILYCHSNEDLYSACKFIYFTTCVVFFFFKLIFSWVEGIVGLFTTVS